MSRSALLAAAGWLAAAALAVLVGLAALPLIGSGVTSSVPERDPADVARELAALPSPSTPPVSSPSPSSPPSVSAAPGTVIRTAGGSVVARCAGTRVQLTGAVPAPGFEVHDEPGPAPADSAEVSFRNGETRYDVSASCPGGVVRAGSRVRED